MIKIFTVMYILFSVYSTNPDVSSPAFSQSIISAAEDPGSIIAETPPPTPAPPEVKDYIEELKTLGIYKQDSKDNSLNKRNAIIRFQSRCNFVISGVWDQKSQEALNKIVSVGGLKYTDSVSAPPTDGKWFVLNKSRRILTLYEKDVVLEKHPVAIGKASTITPSGKFTIVNKIINPAWGGGGYADPVKGGSPENPLGYRWMGLSYKGGGQLGIHGNNSPYSIGKEVSHGCIRMINNDVEALFPKIPLNSPVWIGSDKELEKWGILQPEYPQEEN